MTRPVVALALAIGLSGLEGALLRWFGGGAFTLSLALPLVVYLGLNAGDVEGALGSAAVGWVMEASAGGARGLLVSLAVGLFLFSRWVGGAVALRGVIGLAALTAVGTFLFGASAILAARVVSPPDSAPAFGLLGRVAVEALLTGLVAPLVAGIVFRIDAFLQREEPGLLG